MQRLRMVPVTRVTNGFHARVVAARLGSEGIVTQLRGGIDTPYPTGDVEVLVSEADLDDARALLLADEVESAFAEPAELSDWSDDDTDGDDEAAGPSRRGRRLTRWTIGLVLVLLVVFAYVDTIAYAR